MPGYYEPKIFLSSKDYFQPFVDFLCGQLEDNFALHVQAEAARLEPIWAAAAAVLKPHTKSGFSTTLGKIGLKNLFKQTAFANGFLIYGMPIMVEEGFWEGVSENHSSLNGRGKCFNYYVTGPLGGDKKGRMFGTSNFGFLRLRQLEDKVYPKAILFPVYTIPSDFIRHEKSMNIIEQTARLSSWVNHDYFHQMIYMGIHSAYGHRNPCSPMIRFMECKNNSFDKDSSSSSHLGRRQLETSWAGNELEKRFKLGTGIEPWAMRFHRIVLTEMAKVPGNILANEVQSFIESFSRSGLVTEKKRMSDPNLAPQDYAMRLLAFNIVRAISREHPLTQEAVRECKRIFNMSSLVQNMFGTNVLGPTNVFNGMYKMQYTNILFGKGEYKGEDFGGASRTSDGYTNKVLGLSAYALNLAGRDARQALALARSPLVGARFYLQKSEPLVC